MIIRRKSCSSLSYGLVHVVSEELLKTRKKVYVDNAKKNDNSNSTCDGDETREYSFIC